MRSCDCNGRRCALWYGDLLIAQLAATGRRHGRKWVIFTGLQLSAMDARCWATTEQGASLSEYVVPAGGREECQRRGGGARRAAGRAAARRRRPAGAGTRMQGGLLVRAGRRGAPADDGAGGPGAGRGRGRGRAADSDVAASLRRLIGAKPRTSVLVTFGVPVGFAEISFMLLLMVIYCENKTLIVRSCNGKRNNQ